MKTDAILVQDYLSVLRTQRQLSPHTLSNYTLDLQDLQEFSKDRRLADLAYSDLRRLTSKLHVEGLNPTSIARKLSCWRGFYRWLKQTGRITENPLDGIKAPKKAQRLPKALGVDDTLRLFPKLSSDDPTLLANRAMFELLYSSGLRVSELVGLDIADSGNSRNTLGWLDPEQAQVCVTGKGNKQRIVPVGKPALAALKEWLIVREKLLKQDTHALFLSSRGTRISVRLVQLRLKAYAQSLAIPANLHPHVLRHSFASHVLQSSGDLRAVQEMLGHSSIASTQIYTSLDFQHLAKVYDATHPRAKKS